MACFQGVELICEAIVDHVINKEKATIFMAAFTLMHPPAASLQ